MANRAPGEAGDAGGNVTLPGNDGRSNGLAAVAPQPMHVLVTGGAGYIGCVLTERLLERGHRVRVLDDLWWGEEPLAGVAGRIELVKADVREVPPGALDEVDAVIHLAGLSNDPTAEYDPEANWQMNALASESLANACASAGIRRFVLASSCSLYDGLPPGMHDEDTLLAPRGAYATSKRYAEEALLKLAQSERLDAGIVRNGTVYGWSPRMRYDLVVNTFVKDALLKGELQLHGGGWMWRPLVDVRDCADAMVAVMEAPAEKIRGQVFNVLHSNYQIRELAMLVAGSVQMIGRDVRLVEAELPRLTRDYECSNAKLSLTLGFNPARSVVQAVADLLSRIDMSDLASLEDPRHFNIRWLEQMREGVRCSAS